jgi:uncharacterized metal-binding protein YceD (DUF177 family)
MLGALFKEGTPHVRGFDPIRSPAGGLCMTEAPLPRSHRLRTGGLSQRKPTLFDLRADADQRAALAADLGLLSLTHLRLTGEIQTQGRDELTLTAQLQAEGAQACVVTLARVPARIDEPVRRRYVAGLAEPHANEVEIPEDDSQEPMPEEIDLLAVAAEALALALPLYPRAPGAELGELVQGPAGVAPLTEEALKPFAGLAGLAEKLTKPGSGSD